MSILRLVCYQVELYMEEWKAEEGWGEYQGSLEVTRGEGEQMWILDCSCSCGVAWVCMTACVHGMYRAGQVYLCRWSCRFHHM